MVKTEASHAFNIGSNPVRVTKVLTRHEPVDIIQVVVDNISSSFSVVCLSDGKNAAISAKKHVCPTKRSADMPAKTDGSSDGYPDSHRRQYPYERDSSFVVN